MGARGGLLRRCAPPKAVHQSRLGSGQCGVGPGEAGRGRRAGCWAPRATPRAAPQGCLHALAGGGVWVGVGAGAQCSGVPAHSRPARWPWAARSAPPRPPGQWATAHAILQATPPKALSRLREAGVGCGGGGGACDPCRGVEGVQSGGRALRCCSSCSARQRPARTLPGAPQQHAGSAQRVEAQHSGRAGGVGGGAALGCAGGLAVPRPRKCVRRRVQRGPCDTCLCDSCAGGCSQASSTPCAKKPKDKCRCSRAAGRAASVRHCGPPSTLPVPGRASLCASAPLAPQQVQEGSLQAARSVRGRGAAGCGRALQRRAAGAARKAKWGHAAGRAAEFLRHLSLGFLRRLLRPGQQRPLREKNPKTSVVARALRAVQRVCG
jgi:hypothetical protein